MVTKSMIHKSRGNPNVVLYKVLKNTFVQDFKYQNARTIIRSFSDPFEIECGRHTKPNLNVKQFKMKDTW